ncbi:unnamed protein product [Mytilus coruscus]|uniref:Endonuclease/exonuclease/phosphatase domain-containing protein n=1 Tax=Mytilus coruscus TaxID=42192 RepID=A0A6J8AZK2_MYTCO|nr:unnamed protein product [Mytilus coruscus]
MFEKAEGLLQSQDSILKTPGFEGVYVRHSQKIENVEPHLVTAVKLLNDVNDLFKDLESVLENYSTQGISFICGDTNSRTSTYDDYIKEDNLPDSLADLTSYSADSKLSLRVNPDLKINTWGLKLLSLCKSSGFRIDNGHNSEGYSNSYTYCDANGTSVNDYLITHEQNFELIRRFIVCSFTTLPDHAPLHFEFDSVQETTVNIYLIIYQKTNF